MAVDKTRINDEQLLLDNRRLRERLAEAEETLEAIRNGEVDAIVVSGMGGEQIYSLTSAETPYRIILEEMNEGAVTLSAEGTILYSNRRFAELVNTPVERIVGTSFIRFIAGDDRTAFQVLLTQGCSGRSCGIVVASVMRNDKPLFLQLSLSPLPGEKAGDVCLIAADITELKNKECELVEIHGSLERRVAERTAEKTELLNEVNHRVKNNLMMILGLILAEKRRTAGAARGEIDGLLEKFENRIGGLLKVHQILSDSKWKPVNLSHLAERVCRGLLDSGLNGGQTVVFSCHASEVEVSPRLAASFAIVFNELLSNSLKYAFLETDAPRVSISSIREGDEIFIDYRDNGSGYPMDVLNGKSFQVGLKLIHQFIEGTLDGEIRLSNDGGAVAAMKINIE